MGWVMEQKLNLRHLYFLSLFHPKVFQAWDDGNSFPFFTVLFIGLLWVISFM